MFENYQNDAVLYIELHIALARMPYDFELIGREEDCTAMYSILQGVITSFPLRELLYQTYFDLLVHEDAYWELLAPDGGSDSAYDQERIRRVIGISNIPPHIIETGNEDRIFVKHPMRGSLELHPSRFVHLNDALRPGEDVSPETIPSLVERVLNSITQEHNVKFRLRKPDEKPPDPNAMYYLLKWKPER